MLATIALAVCTTFLVNMGKAKYAWVTAVPMCFVAVTTLTAGVLGIQTIFWPLTQQPGKEFQGYLDSALMSIFIIGVVLVLIETAAAAGRRCTASRFPEEAFGEPEKEMEVRLSCC